MDKTTKLANAPIGKLLISLAIPAIIAQLVNIIYNMVDRIYIGRVENSELAMSALAVSLPVVTIITAFTALFGTGGAPLAAMRLGQGDKDGANKILSNSFTALSLMGVVITVLIFIFNEPLLYAFGAVDENIQLAKEYITIYSLGTICVQYSLGLNPYINTQGQSKLGMATVLIGAVINIILDPIFIFGFNMGVRGAALATIIAQGVSAVWVLIFFFGKRSVIRIKKEYLRPQSKIIFGIMALGISPFIMTGTEGLLQITFNNQLKIFGGTLAVGALPILASVFQMLFMTVSGLTQGAQPIMSYNYGSRNMKRVRETFKLLLKISATISIVGVGIVCLFPQFFASIFTNEEVPLKFATWALRPYLLGASLFGIQCACQQSFLALGQAKRSLIMAIFRKIILLIPLIFILPNLIGGLDFAKMMAEPIMNLVSDGGRVYAVLVAESISDALAAIVTGTLFYFFYKKDLQDDVAQLN